MWLTLNVGSSNLKAAFYRQGSPPSEQHSASRVEIALEPADFDAARGLARVAALWPGDDAPAAVVHRIVHGGHHVDTTLLTEALCEELRSYAPLAPLHQPMALAMADASRRVWPNATQIAVFDTAWHATLAEWSRRLPLPQSMHDAGVMRYGFHGLAFQSVMRQLSAADRSAATAGRLVLAHLGGGCSACAVRDGASMDTTMGFTPLDGLPMATRSGTLDPGVIFFMERQLGLPVDVIERMLWQESGLLGVSGRSGDMRRLLQFDDARSKLAVEQFVIRVAQAIASLATGIGGIDALVFSGGIGSHSPALRARVVAYLEWLGVSIDPARNAAGAGRLESGNSRARIWSFTVDEELELAEAGAAFLNAERIAAV